jgi:hypothetical protein
VGRARAGTVGNRTHLKEWLSAETRLLDHVCGALDAADTEPAVVSAAARIAGLLEECRQRHTELHGRLVSARTVFLDEHTRQSFRPAGGLRNPDITDGVFLPVLTMPADDAINPAETFAVLVEGTQVPRIVRFADLVDDLLARVGRPTVPMRERSLELFGDEKRLDRLATTRVFASGALTLDLLRCHSVSIPFASQWVPGVADPRGNGAAHRGEPSHLRVAAGGHPAQCRRRGPGRHVGYETGGQFPSAVLSVPLLVPNQTESCISVTWI